MLYVGIQESVLIAPSALSIKEAIRRIPHVLLGEHTDLQISLGICTDLELRSSSPAHNLTFMLEYINVYEEKNAEET